MKKRSIVRALLVLLGLAIIAGCMLSRGGPGVLVLEAQSLPVALKVRWDPNAAAENVVAYQLTVDGGTAITVAPVVDPACSCIQAPITLSTFGPHTVSVVAVNLEITGDPTSEQYSSSPTSVSFVLNRAPGNVKAAVVKKQ